MSLTVVVDLPAELETRIRSANPDLDSYAREVLAVQWFREGELSHFALARTLGLDRFETDALLKRYRVEEHGFTHDEVDAEVASLNESLGSSP